MTFIAVVVVVFLPHTFIFFLFSHYDFSGFICNSFLSLQTLTRVEK